MPPRTKLSDEQKQEILADYMLEVPVAEIYEKYKNLVSSTTISRLIRASGIQLRSTRERTVCEECDLDAYRKGLCKKHYRAMLAEKKGECKVDDCTNLQISSNMCNKHYRRVKAGMPLEKDIAAWINSSGYICEYIPNHIQANSDGRTLQHRRVMAEHLGRRLLPNENVHHINGDKLDNRLENLELWVKSQPAGQRVEDLVKWAREILERYDIGN